jgi:hypothetical protein
MSLKTFHLIFISACVALAFGFGVWLLKGYAGEENGAAARLWGGIVSIAAGLGLIVYERMFLKKTRNVSYL